MLNTLNDIIWGNLLLTILLALGFTFTFASRFIQFRYFIKMFQILGQAFDNKSGHLSSFQALALSVAGRVGAGNIAGVAVAITLGGPGAIFWMWVIGLLGMSTSFFECTLAQLYKTSEINGSLRGGPAHYITMGLNKQWLAALYSILLLITFGFSFNSLQSYTISSSLNDAFGIPAQTVGIATTLILSVIFFGGIRRIAQVSEIIVPLMAIGYFLITFIIIIMNIHEIPGIFLLIIKSAFGLEPAFGGGVGVAILIGVKRGLFSNEAGLGSAPNVAAVAYVKHPVNQGIVQAFSVFLDTLILCSCTAFIILLSDSYHTESNLNGVALTQISLAEHIGEWGRIFVSIALTLFAFSSVLYNYYLGENSIHFFFKNNRIIFNAYRIGMLILIFWGSTQDLTTVFAFADITMGLLAIVNLAALILLFKTALRIMQDYDDQLNAGITTPIFDPDKFDDLKLDKNAWNISSTTDDLPSSYDPTLQKGKLVE